VARQRRGHSERFQWRNDAYIRLLQPLDHPAIGGGWDIVLADAGLRFHIAPTSLSQRYAVRASMRPTR
jgi:hypothetical protein